MFKYARKSRAFTLVELLVVISIIALLMGVLIPALSEVARHARQTICGSNLRQLGYSAIMYAGDNNGWFPYKTEMANAGPNVYYTPRYKNSDFRHFWKSYVPGYVLVKRYEVHEKDFAPKVMYCPSAVGTSLEFGKCWPYKDAWGSGYDVFQIGYDYFDLGDKRKDRSSSAPGVWKGTAPMPEKTTDKGSLPLFGDPIIYIYNLSSPIYRLANHWRHSKAKEWSFDDLNTYTDDPAGVNNVHTDGSVKWYDYPKETEEYLAVPYNQFRYFWGKK